MSTRARLGWIALVASVVIAIAVARLTRQDGSTTAPIVTVTFDDARVTPAPEDDPTPPAPTPT
ncbi:MAG: hypothetical protein NT062_05940, partial [Proteobacteria bacterium]|nr:hypothetical protein [Pseudomonadota bacterium]